MHSLGIEHSSVAKHSLGVSADSLLACTLFMALSWVSCQNDCQVILECMVLFAQAHKLSPRNPLKCSWVFSPTVQNQFGLIGSLANGGQCFTGYHWTDVW
jgi:hypothetical protein